MDNTILETAPEEAAIENSAVKMDERTVERPSSVVIKQSVGSHIFTYLVIVAASILRSLNLQIFILPNNFAPGGVTGISAMIQYATGGSLNAGLSLLIFNVPLIILSLFFLSKTFAIRTAVAAFTTSGLLLLFNFLKTKGFDFGTSIKYLRTDQPMLAALAGGVISGISLAMLLKSEASTGGMDIIASIIHKKRPDKNIGFVNFTIDAIVVFSSLFVYDNGLDPMLLAFILIFVSSFICDNLLAGAKSALKFEIVTKEPEEVSKVIMKSVGRSVTMMPAIGMYQKEQRSLLVCIVRKREVAIMQKIIKEFPNTFCFVSNTSDVYGVGFSSRH